MLGSVMCFAALDATSKHLSQTFPIPMMVWARYTLHCLLMVIFLAPTMRWQLIATDRPLPHIGRALMLVGTTAFAMAGFQVMPLAETTAILFVTPLLVVILAAWRLNEAVTPSRWCAVLIGFTGALLIARPGGALALDGVLFMALAATCYAIYQVQTRHLSATENTITLLFYTALVGSILMTLTAPLYWSGPTPDLMQAITLGSLGIFGGTGHLLLTRAFRHAAASVLSPLLYVQLIWATLLGWIFFDQLPDRISVLGMMIIVGSSAFIALSEHLKPANK